MKNKKSVMAFAGLQILFFHLWIPVTGSAPEVFLQKTAYVGVDLFFFLTGLSLGSREIEDPKAFIKGRFSSVYLKFLLLAVTAFFVSRWKFGKLLTTLTGLELLKKGGGSFLWYVPAVMLVYLAAPLLQKACRKSVPVTLAGSFLLWFAAGLLVERLSDYTALFIFWNRVPVILLGFFLGRSKTANIMTESFANRALRAFVLLPIGFVSAHRFAYLNRLQSPFPDFFYVMILPLALGFACLLSLLPENRVIRLLGNATLELYGLQMIFGYKIAGTLLKATGNALITNLCTGVILCVLSVLLSLLFQKSLHFLKSKIK